MKEITAEDRLEIATRLMSSTNYNLYIQACEILEREDVKIAKMKAGLI
jgi:hypothetical protein